MVSTALHDLPVNCKSSELSRFTAPSGSSCGEYMESFFSAGGAGYLVSNSTSDCEYCAYKVGDEFYNHLNISFDNRWRDLGIFFCFVVSNVTILFLAVSTTSSLLHTIISLTNMQ
jgi:ABC-type multidrug transport system permease subunit